KVLRPRVIITLGAQSGGGAFEGLRHYHDQILTLHHFRRLISSHGRSYALETEAHDNASLALNPAAGKGDQARACRPAAGASTRHSAVAVSGYRPARHAPPPPPSGWGLSE